MHPSRRCREVSDDDDKQLPPPPRDEMRVWATQRIFLYGASTPKRAAELALVNVAFFEAAVFYAPQAWQRLFANDDNDKLRDFVQRAHRGGCGVLLAGVFRNVPRARTHAGESLKPASTAANFVLSHLTAAQLLEFEMASAVVALIAGATSPTGEPGQNNFYQLASRLVSLSPRPALLQEMVDEVARMKSTRISGDDGAERQPLGNLLCADNMQRCLRDVKFGELSITQRVVLAVLLLDARMDARTIAAQALKFGLRAVECAIRFAVECARTRIDAKAVRAAALTWCTCTNWIHASLVAVRSFDRDSAPDLKPVLAH